MIKAVFFDFYGVLNKEMSPNEVLLVYIKSKLKPRYKLGIISNATDEFMYQIIPQEELQEIFDDILISYQAGAAKPDPRIYKAGLKNLGVEPEEAVFIDDIEAYCVAARALGMQAIRYESFEQMERELEPLLSVADN